MSDEIKNKADKAFFDFFLEADEGQMKDYLERNIENMDAYERKKKRILFLTKAAANKQKNDQLLKAAAQFQSAILKGVEKPIAILKGLIQEQPSLSLYRNLDKLSEENIIEIIKDKNLVELLEKLENEEDE